MEYRLSDHAINGHKKDKWNAKTIKEAIERGTLRNTTQLEGTTADVIFGTAPDNQTVGLIISKIQKDNQGNQYRVVITGYAASEEYWRSV